MSNRLSYASRIEHCSNPLAKSLLALMHEKKTNLSLSADVTTAHELLSLAEQLGPEICVLKTHIDILSDFHPAVINQLMALAKQHHFLIFEDRKFADIGNTVKHQYEGGVYRIADWADIINAHSLPGDGIVAGLASVGQAKQRGLLLLAEMSSLDNLFTPGYTKSTVQMAERFPEFVMGFIAQHRLSPDPRWIYMTPGIQMAAGKDTLGQQYTTPRQAIVEQGSDVIIVGRGIITAADPVAEAKRYRKAGWEAYLEAL